MPDVLILLFVPVLWAAELMYFRLARKYGILDKPNERSLHEHLTIRGGGVIFALAPVLYFSLTLRPGPFFISGLLLVAIVGFIDDVRGLSARIRFGAQSVAFLLIFYELHLYHLPVWILIIVFLLVTGAINAFNFMDGINGITGGYSLVVLGSLAYANETIAPFTDFNYLLTIAIALLIFNFYNFRNKAICFAGDVGSLSIGLTLIYLVMRLILQTHNFCFILFLAVYGIDSILTILHRLMLRENIFKPHLHHLFQVIVARKNISHPKMTLIYMAIQAIVSAVALSIVDWSVPLQYWIDAVILLILSGTYIITKVYILKTSVTFGKTL